MDYSDTSGYGSSDHISFTPKQVPVLFFFSGLHSDYHKPSDTWDKIDAPDAAKVLQLVADVTETCGSLRTGRSSCAWRRRLMGKRAGPLSSSFGQRLRTLFRLHPGFRRRHQGSEVLRCARGSPAAKAGFKAGDVMVEFDGKPIQNLYDFTYALRAKKPGDVVKVKVLRNGAGGSQGVADEAAVGRINPRWACADRVAGSALFENPVF